jgi:alkylation response protein AidB-like acyl-CoA dehydrogenase
MRVAINDINVYYSAALNESGRVPVQDTALKPEMETATPSPDELVQRAASLVPLLRDNAIQAEQLRRLPEGSVRALEQAGLFRMLQPIGRGGYVTDPATVSRVMTTIASGCASTTWVMMIYSAVSQLAELLSEQALAEIYAAPHPKIAGVFGRSGAVATRAEGGFRVRGVGRWPFNSGCHHAQWDLLRLTIEEPDGSNWSAFAAVPMSELTFCDDWNVMGAMGTGSNSVSCGGLFIPEHRVARVPQDMRGVIRADASVATNCALPLGMARHALEFFIVLAKTKGINQLGHTRMCDAPVVQSAVAAATIDVKMIESYQQWALSTYKVETGVAPKDAAIMAIGGVRCFELARGIIERLFALCPSSEVQLTQPLQRLVRDIHVFQHQHAATPYSSYELFGRRFFAE